MKLSTQVVRALEETGFPWHIEPGTKHHKIRLNNRLVAIYPKGKKTEASMRADLNVISNIRRVAREMQ